MGIYARFVFPRLVDWSMRADETVQYRKALVPRARGLVLEIGFGSGLNLPFYTDQVERVVGLDPSRELLRLAAMRSSRARVPVHVVRGTAEGIPLQDGSVETGVMTWVLCSIPDARR